MSALSAENEVATIWLPLLRVGLIRNKGEVNPFNYNALFFSFRSIKWFWIRIKIFQI